MKDWNGNKASAKSMMGVNYKTSSTSDREQGDYYATDPIAVRHLYEKVNLPDRIWECACGAGHLSEELKRGGYSVISTDLIDRGYGHGGVDFLNTTKMPGRCKCILTNPPYKYANEFILHALDLLPIGGICAMLLNICYLSGKQRYEKIYKTYPPTGIYIFTGRVHCYKNGEFKTDVSSAINYAWFVWKKGNKFPPIIDWIEI